MDLNNNKQIDFSEFSKILIGSIRAEYRLRALFSFYVYDEGQKGLNHNHSSSFILCSASCRTLRGRRLKSNSDTVQQMFRSRWKKNKS
jgi:hypothetical protein